GVDLQRLDDAFDGRGHRGAGDAVVDGDAGGAGLGEVGALVVQVLGGVRAEAVLRLLNLALDLVDGGLCTRNRQRGGVHLAARFRCLA
nr:hypothetical protein [Tanacetum cinerariifolium]